MAMENLVGDAVPSEGEIEKILKDIDATRTKLEKYTYDLNPEGRQRALKPPEGSESTTELIARLLTKHEVSLPGVSAEEMLADLAIARRMSPLVDALTTLLRTVQDTILQANSERWAGTTAGYTALVRAMGADASLENELKPAMEAFGVGRKRKPREPK